MVAPSGEQHEIGAGGYRAVVTQGGASLRLLEYGGRPLLLGWDESAQATSGRGQLLAPWPNRIRDGRYTFEGRDLQLPLSEPARRNASHGLVRWAAWTLLEHAVDAVTLGLRLITQTGYPWTLDLEATYAVSADGLTVRVTATNRAASPAPYALGAHPYLRAGDGPVDDWVLTLPADTSAVVDDRMIPTGRVGVEGTDLDFRTPRLIGDTSLDTAFTGLEHDAHGVSTVRVDDPASGHGVELWADATHHWLQVYTGDDLPALRRRSLAVEPMTAPPNAFATGEDLVVLAAAGEDGDRHVSTWGVRAR